MGCYSTISNQVSPKVLIPAVAALMTFDAMILALTILRFVRIRESFEFAFTFCIRSDLCNWFRERRRRTGIRYEDFVP